MTFDWNNPYPTIRSPLMARNVVATSQALASQAGLRMLQQGGNAVDAGVAAGIADLRRAGVVFVGLDTLPVTAPRACATAI